VDDTPGEVFVVVGDVLFVPHPPKTNRLRASKIKNLPFPILILFIRHSFLKFLKAMAIEMTKTAWVTSREKVE